MCKARGDIVPPEYKDVYSSLMIVKNNRKMKCLYNKLENNYLKEKARETSYKYFYVYE